MASRAQISACPAVSHTGRIMVLRMHLSERLLQELPPSPGISLVVDSGLALGFKSYIKEIHHLCRNVGTPYITRKVTTVPWISQGRVLNQRQLVVRAA